VESTQASRHHRRILRESGKLPLSLDGEAMGLLCAEGLEPGSVLEEGRRVTLRRKNNISSGGEQLPIRLTDVHPDNAALAVRAARLLFLDIAGVDLIIPDIAKSWLERGALVCEVNAMPQVGVRTTPAIYCELLQRVMGEQVRIPAHLLVVAETGEDDWQTAQDMARALGCNAISTAHGIWIDGSRAGGPAASAFTSASSVLRDSSSRAALCVMPLAEIQSEGLPLDLFDSITVPETLLGDLGLMQALQPHTSSVHGRA
jgi:cyanophycin synthetase